jgi:hypothetical protein
MKYAPCKIPIKVHLSIVATLVTVGLTLGNPHSAKARPLQARLYYMSTDFFQGNQALTACERGFHMASLWEIFNLSLLTYDTSRGFTSPDSGFGPPSGLFAWIRTGRGSHSVTGQPGVDNCAVWTSNSGSDNGTVVSPVSPWVNEIVAGNALVLPWRGLTATCDANWPVWCVEDR